MDLSEFKRSLAKAKPSAGVAPALVALWWAGKDEWEKAHRIVMDEAGKDCAWVHAYLHRVEGDLANGLNWGDGCKMASLCWVSHRETGARSGSSGEASGLPERLRRIDPAKRR